MDVNLVICNGTLRADPELRYTQTGAALASILLETTRTTPHGPATSTLSVTFWGEQAESLTSACTAGERILNHGSLRNRKVEHEGRTTWRTEIHATSFQSLTA
ncbi:MAG: single-stranded DNA-binding protein [Chloroflexi bacterium]|nr:single-stranded DNA-binding protein [Chloroflexota bacterium]